jgi:hypothetical protein
MNDEKTLSQDALPDQESSDEEMDIIYEEEMSWGEVIHCVYAAFMSIDDIDIEMASPLNKARIKRIKRKGLRLLDVGISEIYAEKFETEDTYENTDNIENEDD